MIKYFVKLQDDLEWTEMIFRSDLQESTITPEKAVKQFVEQHPEWYLKYVNEFGEHTIMVELKTEDNKYSLFYITINLNYEIERLYSDKPGTA